MTRINQIQYLGLVALLQAGFSPPIYAAPPGPESKPDIEDYLAQDVCLDPRGKVIIGLIPTDARCTSRRNLTSNDKIPYHLTKVLPEGTQICGRRRLIRDNILWSRGGANRVVGAVQIEKDGCQTSAPIPAYYSVRWYDSDYAFIMGAWSRGQDGGIVGGGLTPQCAKAPSTSRRYFRNWLLSSSDIPAEGKYGFAIGQKKSSLTSLPALNSACPAEYPSRFLAVWTRGNFKFTSGKTMNAIVSHPYSQVDGSGLSYGRGKQMERTYWTREFGQSRWESWKRDDYFGRKANKSAQELAESFNETGICSKPFELRGNVTKGLKLGPIEFNGGVYSQLATDLTTGESHRWIMAACQDMTATIDPINPGGDPMPDTQPVTPRFWEFWR
ncbi:hypothetical protein [Sphingobium yanoikuyae]|uniref:hypothetical protein n=1 Tax=Sphingobium yanoikuyae TaxID=13690 RepID=UPI0028A293CD|nr:hypothetical protein [Sphingobium yanoikuyae]